MSVLNSCTTNTADSKQATLLITVSLYDMVRALKQADDKPT